MTIPTCVTCDYFHNSLFNPNMCNRPNLPVNHVNGRKPMKFCDIERKGTTNDPRWCDEEGKYHSSVFPIKEVK